MDQVADIYILFIAIGDKEGRMWCFPIWGITV